MNLDMLELNNYIINSNLLFKDNLLVKSNTGKVNINQAHIEVGGKVINQGLDTSIITTNTSETKEINPDYKNIAKSSAITGAIAGGMVVAKEFMKGYTKTKQTMDTAKDRPLYKGHPDLYKPGGELYGQKPVGVIDASVQNVGSAHYTMDPSKIGTAVPKPIGLYPNLKDTFNEGSWLMGTIESKVPGMHNMSIFHDMWGTPDNKLGVILGTAGINQATIFIPAIPLNYCMLNPALCGSIVGDKFKPNNGNKNDIYFFDKVK